MSAYALPSIVKDTDNIFHCTKTECVGGDIAIVRTPFYNSNLRYSDVLHNFALKKINLELDDIRTGTAKTMLSKLDLHSYNFGSEFPVFEHFRLTDPEGFDPYELPNAISIDFDVNYDANDYTNDSKTTPFQELGNIYSITTVWNCHGVFLQNGSIASLFSFYAMALRHNIFRLFYRLSSADYLLKTFRKKKRRFRIFLFV